MYTVLIAVDTSEMRAVAQTETAAKLPDAADSVVVHILHVVDDPERANEAGALEEPAVETAHERLTEAGVRTHVLGRAGDPATEILQAAEEVHPDLILLGGRKRSALGSALFGSVSQEVIQETGRPVVVTGGLDQQETPTHRCQSCGEEYASNPDVEIGVCRSCGGTKVERIEGEPPTP
jgi:nucleotide-binding universal stress UspA family protein